MAKRYLRLVRFFLLSRLLLKPPSIASCCTVLCNSVSGSEYLYQHGTVPYCIIPVRVQYQTRAQDATVRARRAVESTRPFAGNSLPSHTAVSSALLLRSSIILARYGCLRIMGSALMLGQCRIDWPYNHLQVMFDICVLADTAKATSLVSRSL